MIYERSCGLTGSALQAHARFSGFDELPTDDASAPVLYENAKRLYTAKFNLDRGGIKLAVTVTVPASYPDLLPRFSLCLAKVGGKM